VAFLLLLFFALPLHAAITTSALTGRVMAGDAPAAGATVTATSRATQLTRTATTNARGTYWLGALTPGQYDVSFSRTGLTSLTRPVTVELGRVARADARLEPSEDEESVQSTAKTVSVAETTTISTHFSADELERVPLRRDVFTAFELAPVLFGGETILDDSNVFFPSLLGEEALDEVTVLRAAQPVELDGVGGGVILARTRSGTDAFSLSLRGTWSTHQGGGHVLEGAGGGRVVPERLWFFAAGWGGDPTDIRLQKLRGYTLKANAQAGASHHFVGSRLDSDARFRVSNLGTFDLGTTATALRYTGVLNERLIGEAVVSSSRGESEDFHVDADEVAAKISYRAGDHVLAAGGNEDALFVSDRWSVGPWVIDAGVRRDDHFTLPRVAAAFDLQSNRGSHAIVASWGEYVTPPAPAQPGPPRTPVMRIATIGYTSSLESTGAARVDVLHYEGALEMDQIQLDARYRMFDRFEAGGSYVYTRGSEGFPEHAGTALVGLQLPIGGREFAIMALERYDSRTWRTDAGVRYEIPFRRVALTLAADANDLAEAAEYRLWARIRR
jgi:Carboxypeptidase regulatory-like domain